VAFQVGHHNQIVKLNTGDEGTLQNLRQVRERCDTIIPEFTPFIFRLNEPFNDFEVIPFIGIKSPDNFATIP
jgi:hypothetical protein